MDDDKNLKALNVKSKGNYLELSAPGTGEERIVSLDNAEEVRDAFKELLAVAKPAHEVRRKVHHATVVEEAPTEDEATDEGEAEEATDSGRGATVGDVLNAVNYPKGHEVLSGIFNALSSMSIDRSGKKKSG